MNFECTQLECEWNVIKQNCTGDFVTEYACQQSPDNAATVIARYLCNDSNACAISRRPLVYSASLAYLATQMWSRTVTTLL